MTRLAALLIVPLVLSLSCRPAGGPRANATGRAGDPVEPKDQAGDPALERARALLSQMTHAEKLSYIGGENDFFIRAIPRLKIPAIKLADGPLGCRNWGPSTAYPATIGLAASFDDELAREVGRSIGRDCRARGVHVLLAPGVNIQRSPLNGRNFEYLGEDPRLAGGIATGFVQGVQGEGVLATVKHFAANNQEWDRNHVSSEVDERTLREIYFPAFERVVREGEVGAVMTSYNLLNGIYASHHPWLLRTVLREEWGFRGIVMSDWYAVHDALGGALGGTDLEMPAAVHMSPAHLESMLAAGALTPRVIDDKVLTILSTIIRAGFLERPQERPDRPKDDPESRRVAERAAEESTVLLKNTGLLPLDRAQLKKVAVIGPTAHPAVFSGSGSAYVTPTHTVSILDGLEAALPDTEITHSPGLRLQGPLSSLGQPILDAIFKMEIFRGVNFEGNPHVSRETKTVDFRPSQGESPGPGLDAHHYSIRWTGAIALERDETFSLVTQSDDGMRIFIDGKNVLDDWSTHAPKSKTAQVRLKRGRHELKIEYFQALHGAIAQFGISKLDQEHHLYGTNELERALAGSEVAIVCLGYGQTGAENSLGQAFQGFWPPSWARQADLVESEDSDRSFFLPEAELETLKRVTRLHERVVVVLFAGSGVSFEGWIDEIEALLWASYPGQEGGTALARLLLGDATPSAKLPMTLAKRYEDHPSARTYSINDNGKTPYGEGLMVGYRGFDSAEIEPLFPFGYGLSYTSFSYGEPQVLRRPDGAIEVSVAVRNDGARAGSEVIELYVAPPADQRKTLGRPPKKLESYAKVSLPPGGREGSSLGARAALLRHLGSRLACTERTLRAADRGLVTRRAPAHCARHRRIAPRSVSSIGKGCHDAGSRRNSHVHSR